MTDEVERLADGIVSLAAEAHTWYFNPGVMEHEHPRFEDKDDLYEALLAEAKKLRAALATTAPALNESDGSLNGDVRELCIRLRSAEPKGMLSGCMETVKLTNPDGPEAAALIERLTVGDADVETGAEEVFEAMQWAARHAENGSPPDWVPHGNSTAQSKARMAAKRILALRSATGSSGPSDAQIEQICHGSLRDSTQYLGPITPSAERER